jgi:outer membrane biosynthesis protein TonB
VTQTDHVGHREAAALKARQEEETRVALPQSPTKPKSRAPLIAIAVGILAIGGGVAVFLINRQRAVPDSHFVMIERQAAASGESPSPSAPKSDPSTDVPAGQAETARTAEPRTPESPGAARTSDGQRLSRMFQRQQGKIESCFRAHENALGQSPQISIRFQIDTAGKVTSAQVLPAAVAGSALGSCMAGVARSTDFGPQTAPVTFTIPITARKLAN